MRRRAARAPEARGFVRFGLLLAACACSAAPDPRRAPAGGDPAHLWHERLLAQVAEAWADRDLERMRSFLARSSDRGADADQRARYARFRLLAAALEELREGFAERRITAARAAEASYEGARGSDRVYTLGVSLGLVARLGAAGDRRITLLPGGGGRIVGVFDLEVVEITADGARGVERRPLRIELDGARTVTRDRPLALAFPRLVRDRPSVVLRRITLRGRLLFGGLSVRGRGLPLHEIGFEPFTCVQLPKGWRKVLGRPLETLRLALRRPERYRGHLVVASWWLGRHGDQTARDAALAALGPILETPRAEALRDVLVRCLEWLAPERARAAGGDLVRWRLWFAGRKR